MEPLQKYPRIRFAASLAAFLIATLFTSYLAWSEKQPSHTLLESFATGFNRVPLGWVQPTLMVGLGLFFLYIAIDIQIHSINKLIWKAVRWFKKSIFFRFLPFAVFFALLGGFLFGPGLVYLSRGHIPEAYAFLAYGLYYFVLSLFFAMLPPMAVVFVKAFRKRELTDAICRVLCLLLGVISILGAFIG